MFRLLSRAPVTTATLDTSSTNITTAAWVQLVASLPKACSSVEIFNPSGATLIVSTGAASAEDASIVPYTIVPGGSSILLPLEIAKGSRVSLKSIDQTANSGLFVMNFFG